MRAFQHASVALARGFDPLELVYGSLEYLLDTRIFEVHRLRDRGDELRMGRRVDLRQEARKLDGVGRLDTVDAPIEFIQHLRQRDVPLSRSTSASTASLRSCAARWIWCFAATQSRSTFSGL